VLREAEGAPRQEGFIDPHIFEVRIVLAVDANLHDVTLTAMVDDFEVTYFEVNSHLLGLALKPNVEFYVLSGMLLQLFYSGLFDH
jgi:hypothetical protein